MFRNYSGRKSNDSLVNEPIPRYPMEDSASDASNSNSSSPRLSITSNSPFTTPSRKSSTTTLLSDSKAYANDSSSYVEMSSAQKRIYAAYKLGSNYNCSYVLDDVSINFAKLSAALKIVCGRHEILRSTYHDDEKEIAKQVVHPIGTLEPVLRSENCNTRQIAIAMIEKSSSAPFDLENDSPIRVTYYDKANLLHFCIHHIAIDEWSFGCICKDLQTIYNRQIKPGGTKSRFELGPVHQYSEFAACHNRQLEQQKENLDWWAKVILPEHTESIIPRMSLIKLPPAPDGGESSLYMHKLSADTVRRFASDACRTSTPFITWFSLAQAVLSLVSDCSHFILNIPVTDRASMPQFYDTVGFFLNTVAFPVTVDKKSTFTDLCGSVWERYLDTLAYPAPYEAVKHRLRNPRDGEASRELGAELMFVYHDKRKESETPGLLVDAKRLDMPFPGANSSLVIHFDDNGHVPELRFEYKTTLFSEQFMECLGRSFETVLAQIVAENSRSLGNLKIISPHDNDNIDDWSSVPVPQSMKDIYIHGDGDLLLHELILAVAKKHPRALAVESLNGEILTYKQLVQKSRSFAQHLRLSFGIGIGDVVVLMMDKYPSMVISQLAILLCGAAFVNIDPSHEQAVNENKVKYSGAKLVIVNGQSHKSSIAGVEIFPFADSEKTFHDGDVAFTRPKKSDLAYLCFTSGSTGQPKLIPIRHSAATPSIMSLVYTRSMGVGDRLGMLCAVTFDVSVLEVFLALSSGCTLCIPPSDESVTSPADVINKMRISHVQLTPTVVLYGIPGGPDQCPTLRSVGLGGETVPRKLFDMWSGEPGLLLINAYGPSETAIETHRRFLEPTEDESDQNISQKVGRPVPSVRSYVLDSSKRPVLPGCLGIIHISERARGKLNQVGMGYLTPLPSGKENPFFDHPEYGRTYSTGDLGFYDFEGNFYVCGRQDDQVKLHGVRFDLGDVERTITFLSGFEAVAIICTVEGDTRLAVFVKSANFKPRNMILGTTETLRKLREKCRTVMHRVMVPQYWVPVSDFPKSANGKIDRKALRERFQPEREYLLISAKRNNANSTTINSQLESIWTSVLSLDESEVDVHQSFFDAGGHSISAVMFCSRARAAGFVGCTVTQLYKTPTLAELDSAIESRRSVALPPNSKKSTSVSSQRVTAEEITSRLNALSAPKGPSGPITPPTTESGTPQGLASGEDSGIEEEAEHDIETSVAYWRQTLKTVSPLSIIRQKRTLRQSNSSKMLERSFSYESLPPWLRKGDITPLPFYCGIFQLVLQRLWEYNDSAILVQSKQRHPGSFVPIPVSINSSSPLRHFISETYERVEKGFEYPMVPFEKIYQKLDLDKDDFQVAFVYNDKAQDSISSSIDFPLVFNLAALGGSVNISIRFDRNAIDETDVEALCTYYRQLLAVAENGQDTAIGALNMLTKHDQDVLERLRSEQECIDNGDVSLPVHDLIKRRAKLSPDAMSCNFENTDTCTYRELLTKVEKIRLLLPGRQSGNEAICILLEPGIERIAAMLATLATGFAYVPLDIDNPVSRNAFIIQDCNASAILSKSGKHIDALQREMTSQVDVVLLDTQRKEGKSSKKLPAISPRDSAYILYTSGSTGKPKGVEITHEGLSYSMREHRRIYELNEQSRLLQLSPWTFDVSVADIFGTLSAGGTLCLGTKNFLMTNLVGAIKDMGITHLSTTPTLMNFLTPANAPSLKLLAIGGEAMTEHVRDTWVSHAVLLNCYGPTEATVDVIYANVQADTPTNTIGKPLKDTVAYVLNDHLSLMPFGCVGQLAVSGPQLARGYRNRPLENKAFVNHESLGRIYLTGDLAKMSRDGNITILGRIDCQIKLRGQRIEPGEIEETIVSAGAKRAVALLSPDKTSLAVAYTGGDVQKLKRAVKEGLPPYFLPKYWVPMDIPINGNDKVDRKEVAKYIASLELSEYTAEASEVSSGTDVPLSGDKELLLGKAMQTVLGIKKPVYGNSNFFALSGDSISAVRLVVAARPEGLNFTVLDVYRNPTISQLAAVAKHSGSSTKAIRTASGFHGDIPKNPIVDWFLRSNKKNPHWYNQSYLLKFPSLDLLKKLPAAWEAIVNAHPALRQRHLGSRIIVPEHASRNDFKVIERRVQHAGGILEAQSCLNLEHGPISCLALLNADDRYYCFISVHHAVIDIVSWRIIFHDIRHFLTTGKAPEAEYGSYREWCERVKQRQALRNIQQISTSPPDEPLNIVKYRTRLDVHLEAKDTAYLLSAANDLYKTEPVDLLLSGLIIAYSNWSKDRKDVEICFETHGRDFKDGTVDVTRTVGWFTHLLNINFSNASGKSIADVIHNVKDTRAREKKNHDVATPLGNCAPIIFNYSGAAHAGGEEGVFEVVHMKDDPADDAPENQCETLFDIAVDADSDGSLVFKILYSSALYEADGIAKLMNSWKDAMGAVLEATKAKGEASPQSSHDSAVQPSRIEPDAKALSSSALLPLSVPRHTAFFIHPISGLCFDFRLVAPRLPQLDIIGVNDPHFGELDAYESVLHMAEVYASIVTDHQPSGPYVLLGYSFGAHVAIEIARILRVRGEDVNLVLVDASAEPSPPPEQQPGHVKEILEDIGGAEFGEEMEQEIARNLRLIGDYSRSRNKRAYDGPVTLLRTDGEAEDFGNIIRDLKTEKIYGDHYTLFTDEKHLKKNSKVLKKVFKGMGVF